jgi:hypothetical protein
MALGVEEWHGGRGVATHGCRRRSAGGRSDGQQGLGGAPQQGRAGQGRWCARGTGCRVERAGDSAGEGPGSL